MKSSNSFLSNGPLYSLLAVYMPLSVLAAAVLIVHEIPPINIPSFFLIISGFISALSASIYCDFMKDVKASRTSANIRGGIIVTGVFYLLASFFRFDLPLNMRFMPSPASLLVSVIVIYTWSSVISLKFLFNARKRFETYTNMYQGKQLQEVLFQDSHLIQFTAENIDKTWSSYVFQLTLLFILTLVCIMIKIDLPVVVYFLLIIILTGSLCINGFFKIIKWEQYYAGEGIGFFAQYRTKRLLVMFVIVVLCLAAALLFASDNSLLSFSMISGFFLWFFSLFTRSSVPRESGDNLENVLNTEPNPDLSGLNEITSAPLLESIFKYLIIILKYGFIILTSLLFIKFMISPLLNRGTDPNKISFKRRFAKIITEWFNSLLSAIASLIEHFKKEKNVIKFRKYNDEEIRRTAATVFEAYSAQKKRDLKQSLTLFAKLIIWGSEICGVTWKPSLAPGEYCRILAEAANNEDIIRCGEIFEKALYSEQGLSDAERDEFRELVETVVAK